MIQQEMLDEVGQDAPTEEFAMAAYYLIKQVGLSHDDIFGSREYVRREVPVEREGFVGKVLDSVLGQETRAVQEAVTTPGMNAKTFHTYIDLMEKDADEQEKQREKQKMKQSLKGGTMGR